MANDALLPSAPPESIAISIADARQLAIDAPATVEGIVTMVDGKSIYIQDATAGICVRLKAEDATIKLGNTLKAQGKLGEYASLKQLNIADNANIQVNNTVSELPVAKLITLGELANKETAESLESQRVRIEDVVIDPLNTAKDSFITDKDKATAKIYKIVAPQELTAGSKISIDAIVSQNYKNYQLRVADASHVTIKTLAPAEKPKPITISEARKLSANDEAMVKGIVTMVDGYDVFIENASDAGICVNMDKTIISSEKIVIGNTITVTGNIMTLKDSKYLIKVKVVGAENVENDGIISNLPLQTVTLADVKGHEKDFESERIEIKDLMLQSYNPKSNSEVSDGTLTYNVFRMPEKDGLAAGTYVNIRTIVSRYSTSNKGGYQLRIADAADIDVLPDTYGPQIDISMLDDKTSPAQAGEDYRVAVIVEDVAGIKGVKLNYTMGNSAAQTMDMKTSGADLYAAVIPGKDIKGGTLKLEITATDSLNNPRTATIDKVIVDAPRVLAVSPMDKASTGNNLCPAITVKFENASANPIVTMELDGVPVTPVETNKDTNEAKYQPTDNLKEGEHTVKAVITREDKVSTEYSWKFTAGDIGYKAYFGQVHSHTADSDGIGTPEEAFSYAKDKAENIDFLAITDHSNMLLDSGTDLKAALNATTVEGSGSKKWAHQHELANAINNDPNSNFVAILGWEMTWNGSKPGTTDKFNQVGAAGHMNTFNSPFIASREDPSQTLETNYNKLVAYNASQQAEENKTFSQFNHPGKTFGDFYNFDQWSLERDEVMSLLEVGNGEGLVGSSGYFPSYDYYNKALDKGWHVAPSNNQDNHKGKWGDANTARTVVIAPTLNYANVMKALQNRNVYATEDNNLNVMYYANGQIMGTRLGTADSYPKEINFEIAVKDPDASDAISQISVITEGGTEVISKQFTSNEATWNYTQPAEQSYYYLRIVQADGNVAVTAPVWTGRTSSVGMSEVEADKALVIRGDEVAVTGTFFNNNLDDVLVKEMQVLNGTDVIASTDFNKTPVAIARSGKAKFSFKPTSIGNLSLTLKAKVTVNGIAKEYSLPFSLSVKDAEHTPVIMLDGAHNNAYTTGYYANNYSALIQMAVTKGAKFVLNTAPFTDKTFEGVDVLLLPDAHSRLDDIKSIGYKAAELDAFKNYIEQGGNAILTSLADYKDGAEAADVVANDAWKMSKWSNGSQTNSFLKAIGTQIRVGDDELANNVNSKDNYRLYFDTYNDKSQYSLTANMPHVHDDNGVEQDELLKYSFYSGCSVYLKDKSDTAEYLVKADKCDGKEVYTFDADYDKAGAPKGKELYALAADDLPGTSGKIVVAGTSLFSNFEISGPNATSYSNSRLLSNIFDWMILKDQKIADIRKDANADGKPDLFATGERVQITGYATTESMAVTQEKGKKNAFFDVIYLQDETGGITVFGVSGRKVKNGDKLTLRGVIDDYQGDYELMISDEKGDVIYQNENKEQLPRLFATGNVNAANQGWFAKLEGKVERFGTDDNAIIINDGTGSTRVFLDGYIGSSKGNEAMYGKWNKDIAVGDTISALGFISADPLGNRIRVRDTEEIVVTKKAEVVPVPTPTPEPTPAPAPVKKKPQANKDTVNAKTTITSKQVENEFKNAKGTEVELELNGKTSVSTDAFKLLAENKDKELIIKGKGFSWSFEGKDLTGENMAEETFNAEIKLATPNKEDIDKAIQEQGAKAEEIVYINFAHHGKLPGKATVTINLGKENAGKTKHLYYFNDQTNKMEYISTSIIDAEGNATFTIEHCSDYVMLTQLINENDAKKAEETAPEAPKKDDDKKADDKQDASSQITETNAPKSNTGIFVILGIAVAAAAIIVVVLVIRKKKSEQ